MICDYCFQIIKYVFNTFTREKGRTNLATFCSRECNEAFNKDRIEDEKYERKMRRL